MKYGVYLAAGLAIFMLGGCVSVPDIEDDDAMVAQRPRWQPEDTPRASPRKPYERRTTHRPRVHRSIPSGGESWFPAGRRISPRWTRIVIHHSATTAGGARVFDKYHRDVNGWDELGYHFVIGNGSGVADGLIEVGPRWHKQKHGAHCKTPDNYFNNHGIGICLVGDFTRTRPTAAQMASLQRLVGFLSRQCRIGPDQITTHGAVTGKTECPGHLFPMASVHRSLRSSPVAASVH